MELCNYVISVEVIYTETRVVSTGSAVSSLVGRAPGLKEQGHRLDLCAHVVHDYVVQKIFVTKPYMTNGHD